MGILFLFLALIVGCQSNGTSVTSNVWTNHADGFFRNILTVMKWEEVTILYDEDGPEIDVFIADLLTMLDAINIRRTVYNTQASKLKRYLHQIHGTHFPRIHILYVTTDHPAKVSSVMQTVNNFDFNSNRTTDFRIKSKWLLWTYPVVIQALGDVLTDLCHVTAIHQSLNGCFGVNTLVKKEEGSIWTSLTRMSTVDDVFPNIKFHFNGRRLLLGSLPYDLLKKEVINGSSVYSGWVFDLLKDMAADLNFTYQIMEPEDGEWGVRSAGNTTWNGLIGLGQRREVDIVYAEYLITEERSEVLDFILPALMTTSIGIVYRIPGVEDNWTSLLNPLNAKVYFVLLASYIIFSVLFIAAESYPLLDLAGEQKDKCPNIAPLFFDIFGCFFLEGGHIEPRTSKGRLLYAAWLIFCVIIAAVYTANLTSSLLVKTNEIPFTSLADLVKLEHWKFGLMKNSGVQDMFENSTNEENRKIWAGIVKQNKTDSSVLSENRSELMNKVLNGNFAYIDGSVTALVTSRNDCVLSAIDNIVTAQYVSYAVPLNSPLKADLDEYMLRRFEAGLQKGYYNEQPAHCSTTREKGRVDAFSMNNIKGAFGILGIGWLLALSGLLLECSFTVIKRKRVEVNMQ
ncbi:hypothetical protein SNE40_004154 [Patella caerulea]|uniref:Uncharacterized protein n=1 Tax=Patella caerulea TaxID=87958 RepID=A0AAN8KJV1_PATCE